MTVVIFDPVSVGLATLPGDRVVVWSPEHRRGAEGQLVSTAPTTVPVHPAGGSVDLDPGPLMVRVLCRGWADLADKCVTVPVVGPVSLWDLLKEADS